MVLRPLQKLGGNFKTPCVYSGNSTGNYEFNSCVLFLNFDKNYFNIFFAHTSLGFFGPLTSVGD